MWRRGRRRIRASNEGGILRPLRAAFQDKTETDRGKRFDINGAKSAKEIFMREGYFRIKFYKRGGTADAEGAARVFGYCAEHCGDWFTGDFID